MLTYIGALGGGGGGADCRHATQFDAAEVVTRPENPSQTVNVCAQVEPRVCAPAILIYHQLRHELSLKRSLVHHFIATSHQVVASPR